MAFYLAFDLALNLTFVLALFAGFHLSFSPAFYLDFGMPVCPLLETSGCIIDRINGYLLGDSQTHSEN